MKLTYKNSQSKIFETYRGDKLHFLKPFLTVCFLLFIVLNSWAQNAPVSFTFSLGSACKTSAGVYKKNGTLIRTLWSGVNLPSGTHTKTWDRMDDNRKLVTDTGLIVKVLSNNVNYKWEGVIGNTSDSSHGSSVIRAYYRMLGMAISGNAAYYGTGYNEGATASAKFLLNKPQQKISIMYHDYGTNLDINYVATDGKLVYWAGLDPNGGQYGSSSMVSMAYATNVSDDAETMLSAGVPVKMGTGITYKKAIDTILNNYKSLATGMAVQKNGKYLFIAHGGLNKINVFNKTTGASIRSITMTNPREVCVDGNDNLWIVSGTNTVARYTVDSTTGNIAGSASLTLSGLLSPLALAVSPNNYQILVVDGDSSQQIKAFSNYSGVRIWTYGQYGGYTNDPTVTNDKFYFSDDKGMSKQFIAFQPDSSFWVSDGGNERVMHYSSQRAYIDYIMFMPCTYSVQAVKNDPTRVFNQLLEFKIDYSKPLAPNNGSWKLVKNWRRCMPTDYLKDIGNMFDNILKHSNGKTYATINNAKNQYIHYPEVVELPDTGNIRFTGVMFDAFAKDIVDSDGTRRSYKNANGSAGDSGQWFKRTLTGFDKNDNPVWSSPSRIATINAMTPFDPSYDPGLGSISYPVKTSSDILVVFNHSIAEGYHLGGVKVGDNKFLWKTAMSTFKETSYGAGNEYQGDFPEDGSYDIGNGVKVAGGEAYTIEKNIFWNYHGEFWRGSQANKWNHVYDNGLLVSQFGITLPDGKLVDWEAAAMSAGNVISSAFVKVGNDYYLYHCDESVHSGLHRWKITGLNTIAEQTIALTYSTTAGGLVGEYYDGTTLNNANRKYSGIDTVVNLSSVPQQISSATNFSTRWSGFVQPNYTQTYTFYNKVTKGTKLWVDDQLIINQWSNTTATEFSSTTIKLNAGVKYRIRMEISGGTAQLLWSSTSQSKQIIPSSKLYPSELPNPQNDGVDLMEGLPYRSIMEDGMYGWGRNPAAEDNSSERWNVQTNLRSADIKNPDLCIRFRSNTKTNYVTRDLGAPIACLSGWQIGGNLSYRDNDPNVFNANFGQSIDVLDNAGKIICRITNERKYDGKTNPTSVICNGKAIVTSASDAMMLLYNKHLPFNVAVDSTGVTFNYSNFTAIKVKRYDTTSNWKKPTTLRFYFNTSSYYPNYDKSISVTQLKFIPNALSIPVIKIGGASTFCQGDSVSLTSTAASSYLWSTGATTQTIKAKATGNFVVKVKDSKGCILPSDTAKIKVLSAPIPTISASRSTALCTGDSVILASSSAKSYLWNTNDTNVSIKVKAAGSYTVKVKSLQGCTGVSTPTVVTVANYPIAKITAGGPTTFCSGGSVILTADTAKTYLWSNGATTRNVTVSVTGTYSVKVTNASGCAATSSTISVNANGSPATPTISASRSTALCTGDSVILTSSTASAYTWSNGATSQSIIIKSAGSYSVTISNGVGCSATSASTSVTSNSNPATPTISASGSKTFCQGDSVTLTSSAANAYFWNNGATTQNIKVKASGSFSVKITDNNSCSNTSASTSVIVNALPTATISASGSKTFCDGDSVTLTSSTANAYLWNTGATTQNIKVKASGSFSVKITDNNSCSNTSTSTSVIVNALPSVSISASGSKTFCDGDSVILTSSTANAYLWNTGATTQNIKVKASGSFSVKITDNNSCSNTSASTSVNVNALPSVSISASGSKTFCDGDSVILTSSTANAYLWNTGATTQNIKVKASGSFSVKITDNNSCSNTSTSTSVIVNALPTATISASGSKTFCDGDSVILTSSTANAYLWNTGATTQNIKVKASGSFSVKITDNNSCSNTSTSTGVNVNALPSVSISASGSKTFCQGDSVTLTSSAANAYFWNNGATTQNIKVKASGSFSVKITDNNSCSNTSASTSVIVNALPTATISASGSKTFCDGDSVTLIASTANAYLWNTGATTQNIKVKASGSFSVKITDNNSCSNTSASTSVTVNALPTATISASGSKTFCDGDSVILTASTANAYLWNSGATTQNIKVKASGSFSVKITDNNSCSNTSTSTSVNVNALPTATISASGSKTFCQGDSVTLTSSTANAYLWNTGATTQNIKVKASGSFSVKITDNNSCSNTSTSTSVIVNALPTTTISASGSKTFCDGDSVILTASTANAYVWNTGATTQNIKVKASGSFSVKITDNNSCSNTSASTSVTVNALPTATISASGSKIFCDGDSVILTSSTANAYLWNTGATTQNIKVKASGSFSVKITDNNSCSNTSASTSVTVNALPTATISASGSKTFCDGDSVTLTSSTANAYLWNTGATTQNIKVKASGSFSVKITDNNSCSNTSASTSVIVNALPTATISSSGSKTFCDGDSVILTASTANAYLWNSGATTQNIKVKASGSFSVKITDNNSCSNTSASTSVIVNALPTATISASGSKTFCQGDSVTLTSSAANAYFWNNGATTQNIKVKASGSFSVKITDNNSCSNTSASTNVIVNALPTATISASGSKTFCQGDSVTLTSSTANAYLWNTGATTQNIKVKASGSFSVKITDNNSCSNTSASTSVIVNALPTATISASGSKTFCDGDSVILTSSTANAYLWNTGATTQNIKVKASGNFSVKITDFNSCSNTSASTSVIVNALPKAIVIANGLQTFCQGDSVTLTASPAKAYVWSNGEQTASIKIKASGSYNVTVTDQNNCSTISSNTNVTVNPLPLAVITANSSTTFCDGDSVTLTASNASNYLWSSKATSASIVVKNSGQFDVFVKDVNGCSSKSNTTIVQMNQLPLAEITVQQSPVLCDGDSVILMASKGQFFKWNTNDTQQELIVKKSGLYNVVITDGNGCKSTSKAINVKINKAIVPFITALGSTTICKGDSVILKSSFAKQYAWNSMEVKSSIVVKSNSQITVTTIDSNGCSASAAPVNVIVNDLPARPTIVANKSLEICEGDSINLAVGIYSAYLWSNSLSTNNITTSKAGVYAVIIKDNNGCKAISYPLTIKVNSLPKVIITPDGPTTFCEGGSVVLSANVAAAYLWNNNEQVQNILVDAPGIYTVTITDYKHCSNTSDPITVVVNPLPTTPIITVSQNTLTCNVKTSVQWYLNGIEILGATKPQYTMTENGDYSVRISNSTCTAFSESFICTSFKSTNLFVINKISSTLVFPNPTIGPITIQLENAIGTQVLITNAEGKLIYNAAYSEQIDLTGNAMGVYFVTVITTQGRTTNKITLMN